ncbi:MAG: molybdopterin-dependent oxidoreductase [Pseudomonadota bacterium]
MMVRKERTVCDPNCHADPRCGISALVEDGKIISVEAADYPVPGYENRICLMGRSRVEYQYHPDRLRKPLKRVGARGAGEWEEISWDEAIALFVEKQKTIAEKYGPKAVIFSQGSGSNALLNRGSPVRYAALTGATVIGAGGIDYGVAKGLEPMFGASASSYGAPIGNALQDTKNSNLTILWGHNPVVTRSVDHLPLKQAKKTGTKLISIDPVNSETSKLSDQWISLRPGSDGALALSLAHEIIDKKLYDETFLLAHTNMPFLVKSSDGTILKETDVKAGGGDEYIVWCEKAHSLVKLSEARAPTLDVSDSILIADGTELSVSSVFHLYAQITRDFEPEKAEKITEVDKDTISILAKEFAEADPASIRIGFGVDRWYNADLTGRAIATLSCLCGYVGLAGGGVSLIEGHQSVPVRGSNFYAPDGKLPTFMSIMEADVAVQQGTPYPIRMECITAGNFYNQFKPNRSKVLTDYLEKLEFVTVIDHFMTDTAKFADLVLPSATIFERTDAVADRFIQLQQRIVEPEGEAKSDFEIFQAFARAYGIGAHFEKTPEEYLDAMFDTDSPLMTDVNIERLKKEKVIFPWPNDEPFVGFKNREFPTKSGRLEIYTESILKYGAELPYFKEPVEATPKNPLFKKYPLVLLSSHSRYRIHSTFANMEMVRSKEPEPVLRIHPSDARRRGIEDGSVVETFNDRGRMKVKCQIDDAMREGCVLISEGHWVDQFIEGDPYVLTHDQWSPTAENYATYDVLVEMKAAAA